MKRKLITELLSWKNSKDRKPLILRGARQVGKTYLLKQFGAENFPKVHYFNFERNNLLQKAFDKTLSPSELLSELSFDTEQKINPHADLVIFDEIQAAPKALTSLKYFSEELPQLALCAAGSLLGIGLNEESFPVGKVNFLDLYPLSFFEFLEATEKAQLLDLIQSCDLSSPLPEIAHQRLWELLKIYFITGGLPEVLNTYLSQLDNSSALPSYDVFSLTREKQDELIESYTNDIAKHSGKANGLHVERLWRNVPEQLAQRLDGQAQKFKFKDAIPKLRGFNQLSLPLDWLEKAKLIIKIPIAHHAALPLSAYCKENSFKLYMFDVGLLGAMGFLSPKSILDYDYGTYKGYFAENFVAQELRASGKKNLYCWNEKESELEFLFEQDGAIFPIEVKSGVNLRSRSMQVYSNKYDPLVKIKFSAKNITHEGKNLSLPLYLAGRLKEFQF